ncbi:hypothetical protein PHLCEN_2v10688 [Hermanssonia centrifuga]|uniref:Uncharacterized protein n=1 Tax=Hermanssonia centrifuga TaxID=98765 RepID=A0A2R6NM87_9APHY|nr:hypothetical protein PHLCEN_2v10688 [Hermanssonia centrifuga]
MLYPKKTKRLPLDTGIATASTPKVALYFTSSTRCFTNPTNPRSDKGCKPAFYHCLLSFPSSFEELTRSSWGLPTHTSFPLRRIFAKRPFLSALRSLSSWTSTVPSWVLNSKLPALWNIYI